MAQFTLAVLHNGQRRTVKVHIYDAQRDMVEAGRKWNGDPALSDRTAALVQAHMGHHNPQAIARFCTEHLQANIIVHEMVHAAQAIYRWDHPEIDHPASEHFTHYNEQFAHLVSDLYDGMMSKLSPTSTE